MNRDTFEFLVAEAVRALPDEFQERLENIDVVVEDYPTPDQIRRAGVRRGYTLLGLYEGVPLTQRMSSYGLVPPDKITIFKRTIEEKCRSSSESEIKTEIRKVIQHEIAHHFGIDDARLKEIEDGRM